nr:MAG TPA: hypothetical protein [Caudoviricetes sp.]
MVKFLTVWETKALRYITYFKNGYIVKVNN